MKPGSTQGMYGVRSAYALGANARKENRDFFTGSGKGRGARFCCTCNKEKPRTEGNLVRGSDALKPAHMARWRCNACAAFHAFDPCI